MNQELMLGGPAQIYGFHMISSDFDLQDRVFSVLGPGMAFRRFFWVESVKINPNRNYRMAMED